MYDMINRFQLVSGYGVMREPEVEGLYYMRARFYDAVDGRFISRDKLKFLDNVYLYCENNPLIYADPLGLVLMYVSKTYTEYQYFKNLFENISKTEVGRSLIKAIETSPQVFIVTSPRIFPSEYSPTGALIKGRTAYLWIERIQERSLIENIIPEFILLEELFHFNQKISRGYMWEDENLIQKLFKLYTSQKKRGVR